MCWVVIFFIEYWNISFHSFKNFLEFWAVTGIWAFSRSRLQTAHKVTPLFYLSFGIGFVRWFLLILEWRWHSSQLDMLIIVLLLNLDHCVGSAPSKVFTFMPKALFSTDLRIRKRLLLASHLAGKDFLSGPAGVVRMY